MLLEVMEGVTLRGAPVGATQETSYVNSTCYVHIHWHIPALCVVSIMSDGTFILLPNTLNVVVTVTV